MVRRLTRYPLSALALLLGALACSEGNGGTVGPRSDFRQAVAMLEPVIAREMADKDLPGLSIALVDGQDIVWARGFGFANQADSTPATAETFYRVGSIAKLVTAISVLQLVENGAVGLDSPVTRYLPDLQPANRFGAGMTVRQLLSHRAGLVREPPVGSYFDSSHARLPDAIASLNGTALAYAPGSRTKYSDAGMAVAGYLVERVRGQPFASVVQGAVLDQMDLTRSTFAPDLSLDRGLAQGFLWSYDGRTTPAPRFEMGLPPAAGLYSTVSDLARLAGVLMTGGEGRRGHVLKPETVNAMWTRQAGDSVSDGKAAYGLGFRVSDLDGARRVGHSASFDGFSTEFALLPEEKLGAIVIASKDGADGVTYHLANIALSLMRATKHQQPLPRPVTPQPLSPDLAKRLDGRYVGTAPADPPLRSTRGRPTRRPAAPFIRPSVELEERNGRLIYHRLDDELWLELKALGDTLITDDRLGFGLRILRDGDRIIVGRDTLVRSAPPVPLVPTPRWLGLIGEYGEDFNTVYIREEHGRLHALVHAFVDYPLTEQSPDVFRFPDRGLYDGERVEFTRGPRGRAVSVLVGGVSFRRRAVGPEDGSTFKITPLRPTEDLVREALAATPPVEKGEFLKPDLVEVARLDPTIKLDMRYATTNNFVSTAFYREGRAFVQRPAAEALVRINQRLKRQGYGLLIHDAYRPWYVTKMFWDATPEDKRVFVANPASGSRHNRGCAIDLTLYDMRTGRPIEMVSGYDEFSDRAYPDYPGGTSLQRWTRKILRRAMEAEGFTVFSAEWWHFDYRDWRKYPIMNVRFEEIKGR